MDLLCCIHDIANNGLVVDMQLDADHKSGATCTYEDSGLLWKSLPLYIYNSSITLIIQDAADVIERLPVFSMKNGMASYGITRMYCLKPCTRIASIASTQFINNDKIYTMYLSPSKLSKPLQIEEKIERYYFDEFEAHNIFGAAMDIAMHYRNSNYLLPSILHVNPNIFPRYNVKLVGDKVKVSHEKKHFIFTNWFNAKTDAEWQVRFAQLYYKSALPCGIQRPTIGFRLYDVTVNGVYHYGLFAKRTKNVISLVDRSGEYIIACETSENGNKVGMFYCDSIFVSTFVANTSKSDLHVKHCRQPPLCIKGELPIYLHAKYSNASNHKSELIKFLYRLNSRYEAVIATGDIAPAYTSKNNGIRFELARDTLDPNMCRELNQAIGPALECFGTSQSVIHNCALQYYGSPPIGIGVDFLHLRYDNYIKTLIVNPPCESSLVIAAAKKVRRILVKNNKVHVLYVLTEAIPHDCLKQLKQILRVDYVSYPNAKLNSGVVHPVRVFQINMPDVDNILSKYLGVPTDQQ